jgi:hypothetical protein
LVVGTTGCGMIKDGGTKVGRSNFWSFACTFTLPLNGR